MKRSGNFREVRDVRLKRLAERIEALSGKDDLLLRHTREIADLRRSATVELFGICADFVNSVNRLLSGCAVVLDPAELGENAFDDDAPRLIQINVRGRILQVEFTAAAELVSTEDFRIPYTLEGYVRAFNQELLDKNLIEEQLIFYTIEKGGNQWRFFDARTYRSGAFNQEYLVSLMEQIL